MSPLALEHPEDFTYYAYGLYTDIPHGASASGSPPAWGSRRGRVHDAEAASRMSVFLNRSAGQVTLASVGVDAAIGAVTGFAMRDECGPLNRHLRLSAPQHHSERLSVE